MLDLAFVGDHLPAVEEMLRRRGLDPRRRWADFRKVESRLWPSADSENERCRQAKGASVATSATGASWA
jgi:hypothetical protein